MEIEELKRTCDFCSSALAGTWFTLQTCRWDGYQITGGTRLRMCKTCYPKIHEPFHKASVELMRQSLLDATAKIKAELQAAGKI